MIKDNNGRLPYVGEAREGAPCCVKHEHAGGQCPRPAVVTVYGLNYCGQHGEECKLAALSEACHDADQFFTRFLNCEVRGMSTVVERAISHVSGELMGWDDGTVQGRDYYEVLVGAYANPPAKVRAMVEEAESSDEPGYAPFADCLLDSLQTVHKLMREAYEDGVTLLVELLEGERQSYAAQCAYAIRDWNHIREAREHGERPGDAA